MDDGAIPKNTFCSRPRQGVQIIHRDRKSMLPNSDYLVWGTSIWFFCGTERIHESSPIIKKEGGYIRSRRIWVAKPCNITPSPDFRRQFDAIATTWDAEHGPASPRASEFTARISYLQTVCRELGRPRVLDLGCGTGQTLLHLADSIFSGDGVDISSGMIAHAQRNAPMTHLRFQVGDAAEFCLNCRERFELVLLIGALEHLSDQPAALVGVERVLTASGRLIVISLHPWNPVFCVKRLVDRDRDAPPTNHPSPMQLRRIATRCGLELFAVQALPYVPWSNLNVVLDGRRTTSIRRGRSNAFAGMLRGAFAAEFRRAGIGF